MTTITPIESFNTSGISMIKPLQESGSWNTNVYQMYYQNIPKYHFKLSHMTDSSIETVFVKYFVQSFCTNSRHSVLTNLQILLKIY